MNERLEELKKQSMIRVNNPTVNTDGKIVCDNWEEGISLSKFAELIVAECIERGNTLAKHYMDNHTERDQAMLLAAVADYSNEIKKHFGVEE